MAVEEMRVQLQEIFRYGLEHPTDSLSRNAAYMLLLIVDPTTRSTELLQLRHSRFIGALYGMG